MRIVILKYLLRWAVNKIVPMDYSKTRSNLVDSAVFMSENIDSAFVEDE